MKKLFLIISASIIYFYTWAQTNTFPSSGNVGISTTSPLTALDLGAAAGHRFLIYGSGGTTGYLSGMGVNLGQQSNSMGFFIGKNANFSIDVANVSETFPYTSGYTTKFSMLNNGNVGIGITNPQSKLVVNGGGIALTNNGNSVYINGNINSNNTAQLAIYANSSSTDGSFIYLWGNENTYTYKSGSVDLVSRGVSGHGIRFANYNTSTNSWVDNVVIYKDGKMVIGTPTAWGYDGTTTPGDYKLYVEKGILTEKVKVAIKTTASWSDYVFKKGYELMPLNSLEKYVNTNFHLPEVPSAEQVVKEGIDLGNMDSKLLAKVEELTLYIIELNKKIEQLQKEMTHLKKSSAKTN